jgi:hypothetical protein
MEILYYPDMYLTSELLLKQLLLTWGTVRTIVPPSQKTYVDAYLSGEISNETNFPLERYREIYDAAGEKIVDFLVIEDKERKRASERMLYLLTDWNADTRFYDSLKIRSLDDLMGKQVEWYWFLHEKIELPLVELMLGEQLVVNWGDGEIVGFQEIGKSYMSVVASELERSRNVRLITDDEYYLASKGPALREFHGPRRADGGYELVSLAIPQVFFERAVLDRLSWKSVVSIRKDLLPYAESFYGEVERYQQEINELAKGNREDEAFAKFCEFCERVAASFRPFAKEVGKVLRLVTPETLGLVNGILLPAVKLAGTSPEVARICDVAALASTAGTYAASGFQRRLGFEYLENLGRALNVARMKNTVTSLIPRAIKANRGTA